MNGSPHPHGFAGNDAMLLVTAGGKQNHKTIGAMAPTPMLDKSPYLKQVMAAFNTIAGRTRLMRLQGGANVTEHADTNYYWHDHVRIHVPIITHPSVEFLCDGMSIHMPPGESFIFDTWRLHDVINHEKMARVHLVFDTVGTPAFWNMATQGTDLIASEQNQSGQSSTFVPFDPDAAPELAFEQHNAQVVMTPGEVDLLCREIGEQLDSTPSGAAEAATQFTRILDHHRHAWRSLYAVNGTTRETLGQYMHLLQQLRRSLQPFVSLRLASNTMSAADVAQSWLIAPALNPDLAEVPISINTTNNTVSPTVSLPNKEPEHTTRILDRPVFILAAPRSGSSLLFETLKQSDDLFSLGGEAHGVFESIPALHPASRGYTSNRLTAQDAATDITRHLRMRFVQGARNNQGKLFLQIPASHRPSHIRFIEKTPKNSLRIPFLSTLFPDALFIHLVRDPCANIASIIEAWMSQKFITYPDLPEPMELEDCQTHGWSLLLTDGWRTYRNKCIADVAAFQWASAHNTILADLKDIPDNRMCRVEYESFLHDPAQELKRLCQFIGVPFSGSITQLAFDSLPHSRFTLTPPEPDKWRSREQEIMRVLPRLKDLIKQLSCADTTL